MAFFAGHVQNKQGHAALQQFYPHSGPTLVDRVWININLAFCGFVDQNGHCQSTHSWGAEGPAKMPHGFNQNAAGKGFQTEQSSGFIEARLLRNPDRQRRVVSPWTGH